MKLLSKKNKKNSKTSKKSLKKERREKQRNNQSQSISLVDGNKDVRKIWNGYGFDILFGMLYLLKKYSNLCIPINNPTNRLRSLTLSMVCKPEIIEAKNKKDYMLRFPETSEKLVHLIKQCSKKYRFISIPVYIIFDDCSKSGHMNVLLFDTKMGEIERFEPYGHKGYTKKEQKPFTWFDEYFSEWLKTNGLKYKYVSTKNCPNIGPQELEELQIEDSVSTAKEKDTDPGGFCGVWGILFIDYRLQYPEKSTRDVLKIIMKQIKMNKRSIRTWIRDYSVYITQQRELFLNEYNPQLEYTPRQNIWFSSLEKELEDIFNERIYGK